MKGLLIITLITIFLVSNIESAKRCYSGSKDRYESRQCDTGTDGKFVCQKFTCEGGKLDSNFTVRACAPEGSRCESSSTVCADQEGVGYCSICENDDCNGALETLNWLAVLNIAFFVALNV